VSRRLNFAVIERAMEQIVIDLHDAARMTQAIDVGVADFLRRQADAIHDVVREMRSVLASDADSSFGGL